MIRLGFVFIILISCFLPYDTPAIENNSVSHILNNAQLHWSQDRLTGKLQNVSVKSLIREILQKDGFLYEIRGELSSIISISFDQLTVQQCINKIMRHNHFNYALIFDGGRSPGSKNPIPIKELIIYKDGNITRFSRTEQKRLARQKVRIEEKPLPQDEATASHPKPSFKNDSQAKTRSKNYKVEFEGTSQDLKKFVNELMKENRISQDEYEKIMESKIGLQE